MAEKRKPTAPPASRTAGMSSGRGTPCARCTRPSTPPLMADQPMTWRPTGPLRSGWRSVRQAMTASTMGTAQASRPTEPVVAARTPSATAPGTCHQTDAATTIARATMPNPTPSRRCSGSSSAAECPMLRATAPTAPAMPSQIAVRARATPPTTTATGPGPVRGAGLRAAGLRFAVLEAGFLRAWLPDGRLRGGEDVRVAMARA